MESEQKMRRITVELTVELLMPEVEVIRMGAEMDEVLSDLTTDDCRGTCLAVNAVIYDVQDPIAQFQFFNGKGQKDKRVQVASAEELVSLGYKVTSVQGTTL